MLRAEPFRDMAGPLTLIDQASVLNPDTPIDVLNVRVESGGGVALRGGVDTLSGTLHRAGAELAGAVGRRARRG